MKLSPTTGRALCLVAVLTMTAAAHAMSVIDVDAGGAIPPSGTRGVSEFTFEVDGLGAIRDLDVRLSIRHTWDADLVIDLTSPAGTRARLLSNVGLWMNHFQDTLLDDSADRPIGCGWAPFAGPEHGGRAYRSEDPLSLFDGENPNGVWTLTITDEHLWDSGWLLAAGDRAPWGTAIGTQLIMDNDLPAPAPVPEPMTLVGLGAGITAGAGYLRRRRYA